MMSKPEPSAGDEPELGPAMRALAPKQRQFVLAMLADPNGTQSGWAQAAGYSTKGDSHAVVGCRMMRDPRIIAAAQEIAKQHLGGNGPVLAVKNLLRIASNEKHPQNLKATEMILNRTGMHEKSEHRVVVEHRNDAEMEELCRRMALEMNIPVEKLIGANQVAPLLKLIEAEAVEVKAEPDDPFAAVQPEKSDFDPSVKF
jgi:phage terminase small subunit